MRDDADGFLADVDAYVLPYLAADGKAARRAFYYRIRDRYLTGDLDGPAPTAKVEVLCGDPNYMAPEQTRANTRIDARADIYAMGMSLFELTTGLLPFESLIYAPLATLLAAQREAEPDPPSRWLPASR